MNERNVLAGTTATVLSPFVDGWQNLFVWVIVAFALILGDVFAEVIVKAKSAKWFKEVEDKEERVWMR